MAPTGADRVERRIVTVLFADLVGFTTLSEGLDPEDVATVQEAYFDAIRDAIARHGGQLEKFIGDAAMAVFGIPTARDDDMERAVRSGLAIASAVGQIGVALGLDEDVLRVRVGVNTGEVAYTSLGPGEWRATGDTVNVAARLQTAAPPGGVLVGPTTALGVAAAFELEDAGALDLKGKTEPLPAWVVAAALDQPSRDHAMGSLHAPMLGRDDEMATLLEALERVRAGTSERWTVIAPPGTGKTRLTDELAAAAADRGAAILRARLRPDVLAPYAGAAQLLLTAMRDAEPPVRLELDAVVDAGAGLLRRRLLERGASEARAGVVVDEVLAVLSAEEALAQASPDPSGAQERRSAMFRSWLDALDALSDGPQLWIVEDVHWSGPDLLAFLDLAGSEPARRLVLATARPSIRERAPAWLDRARTLDLPALSAPDTARLIHELVGDAIPTELATAIAERSDGNPLFVEELLRTWIGTGVLVARNDGTWVLSGAATEVRLPDTVQAIYAAQLDDLPHDARVVARKGSVAGRRFPVDGLESLEAASARHAGIDVLARRALIAGPTPDPLLGDTYAYRHALLRDTGYASLARADRSRLHVRYAHWLESSVGDRPELAEVIGVHYERALEHAPALAAEIGGLPRADVASRAADWLERGAREAAAIAAFDAARALFERSLSLTPHDQPLLRAKRLQALGQATAFGADMDQGLADIQEAMGLYRAAMTATDPVEADEARDGYSDAAAEVGHVFGQQLRFEHMVALADDVLVDIGERDDVPTARMLVTRGLGKGMYSDAKFDEDRANVERALAIARAAGDHDLELDALALLAETLEDFRTVEATALAHGRWEIAIKAMRTQGSLLLPDRAADALPVADRVAALAESRGFTEEIAWDDYLRAECGLVTGDWELAWDAGLRAIELGERNAYHRATVRTWAVIVLMADACGRADVLQHARGWYLANEGIFPDSPFGRLLKAAASIAIERAGLEPIGDTTPGWLTEAIEPNGQGLPSWFGAIELVADRWLELGEVAATRAWLERLRTAERSDPTRLGSALASLIDAKIRSAEGSDPTEPAREALALASEIPAPWWTSKALRALGERDEAVEIERRLGLKEP